MPLEETTKTWRRDVWKDHLTLEVLKIEVTPENDLTPHISSLDCLCIPEMKDQDGVQMLVHNAFDGREVNENHERGH
jgi:hypothetical protein